MPRLNRRLKGINTSIAEQTWSWFRDYARTLDDMREERHCFIVLHFMKKHNEIISAGDTSRLNQYSPFKPDHSTQKAKKSGSYAGRIQKKVMKAMKKREEF